MIPIGYMSKHVKPRPQWLKAGQVDEVLSVSGCVSEDFADWVDHWKHNGYWFFDSPDIIVRIAEEDGVDLRSTRWFYYEADEKEYDEDRGVWRGFRPETSILTNVELPAEHRLRGYDIVTFSCGTCAEHSPLSCNHLAEQLRVNRHCLLDSFGEAIRFMEDKAYLRGEPGPYRIVAVYEIPMPDVA